MLTQFIGRITTSIVLAGVAMGASTAIAAAQSSTDWGWPQPYEKVSDKSGRDRSRVRTRSTW
jgi:hypothetical protein